MPVICNFCAVDNGDGVRAQLCIDRFHQAKGVEGPRNLNMRGHGLCMDARISASGGVDGRVLPDNRPDCLFNGLLHAGAMCWTFANGWPSAVAARLMTRLG